MYTCPFCAEYTGESPCTDRIIYQSDNFIVFPGLGQIVEGYLLIVPKKHYIAIGELPERLFPELELLCEKVRKVLSAHYNPPLFFEHGPVSQHQRGGCCVDHAHIHTLPVEVDIFQDLSTEFPTRTIEALYNLRDQFQRNIPYFFYESNTTVRYVSEIMKSVPSQYLRRIIAEKIGKSERWDWGICPDYDVIQKTLQKLRGKF